MQTRVAGLTTVEKKFEKILVGSGLTIGHVSLKFSSDDMVLETWPR